VEVLSVIQSYFSFLFSLFLPDHQPPILIHMTLGVRSGAVRGGAVQGGAVGSCYSFLFSFPTLFLALYNSSGVRGGARGRRG
jgi:hypothetical protein